MDSNPKLIVFDLDYTIWPFWVDTHVTPPFRKDNNGNVYDRYKQEVKLYPDTLAIFEYLKSAGFKVAVASRTGAIQEAEALLKLFDLNKFFLMKQIYPGSKIKHFEEFFNKTNIPYKEMLFFDDEQRNIRDLSQIGVVCQFVDKGISWACFEEGMKKYKNKVNDVL